MADYLINCIPDIASKRYLELGTHNALHFGQVQARDKVGVDLNFPTTYQMSTDAYFAQLDPAERFDVIFIDACHEYDYVLRDYNNSVKHLAPDGVLFIHDLVPVTEEFVKPWYSGDGYKLLHYLLRRGPVEDIYPLRVEAAPGHLPAHGGTAGDFGLTTLLRPQPANPPDSQRLLGYKEFKHDLAAYRSYTAAEVQAILRAR